MKQRHKLFIAHMVTSMSELADAAVYTGLFPVAGEKNDPHPFGELRFWAGMWAQTEKNSHWSVGQSVRSAAKYLQENGADYLLWQAELAAWCAAELHRQHEAETGETDG